MTRNRPRTVKARILAEMAAKGKPIRSLSAKHPSVGTVYLIRHQSGHHKIGLTRNWERRSRQLEVGITTAPVLTATVINPERVEATLHQRFAAWRLPQSEWFSLTPEQIQQVVAAIEAEAAKCQGVNADDHLALERMLYESRRLEPGSAAWRQVLEQIEALRRQLDPDYRARAEAREAKRAADLAGYMANAKTYEVRSAARLTELNTRHMAAMAKGPAEKSETVNRWQRSRLRHLWPWGLAAVAIAMPSIVPVYGLLLALFGPLVLLSWIKPAARLNPLSINTCAPQGAGK